ncbi:hypothetical protein KKB18_09445, partial [bacterium]|nr:hypothetical protein [bacterium]
EENFLVFADKLFHEGKFNEALLEYQRVLYFFPNSEERYKIMINMARCHKYSGSYENAAKVLSEIITGCYDKRFIDNAIFELGDTQYLFGEYYGATLEFHKLFENTKDTELKKKAGFMLTFTYLRLDEQKKATDTAFNMEALKNIFPTDINALVQGVKDYSVLERKSPPVAGILSAILPGSGHFYLSRFRDGFVALLLNGLFASCAIEFFDEGHIAPGILFSVIESSIYSGTIFSSVSQTYKYNRFIRTEFVDKLETDIGYHSYSDLNDN